MSPFTVTVVARLFSAAAFLTTSAVVARAFGREARGAVEALAVLRLGLHAVAAAGLPTAATWLVASGRGAPRAVAAEAARAGLRFGAAASLVLAAATGLASHAFAPLPRGAVLLVVALAPATVVGQALLATLLGAGRTTAWNLCVVGPRAAVLLSLGALLVPGLKSPVTVVVGLALAEVLSVALPAAFLSRLPKAPSPTGVSCPLRAARPYARAAFLHATLVFAFARGDTLLLATLAGTDPAGRFAAASLAREVLLFVPWVAGLLHLPSAAAAAASGREARPPLSRPAVVAVALVAGLLLAFPETFVTGLHGAPFRDAASLVPWLVLTALVGGAGHLLLVDLLGRGAPRAAWLAPGLACLVSLLGNAVFVPSHGADATARVALVAAAVLTATAAAGRRALRREAAAPARGDGPGAAGATPPADRARG